MTLLVAVGIVLAVGTIGLTSLAIHTAMAEQVNRVLPADQRFGDAWWGPDKKIRLLKEYRRLYPDGPLFRRQMIVLAAGGLLFALGAVWILWPR